MRRALQIHRHHIPKGEGVIRLVPDILHVGHDLIEMALLHQAANHLLVRTQSKKARRSSSVSTLSIIRFSARVSMLMMTGRGM